MNRLEIGTYVHVIFADIYGVITACECILGDYVSYNYKVCGKWYNWLEVERA